MRHKTIRDLRKKVRSLKKEVAMLKKNQCSVRDCPYKEEYNPEAVMLAIARKNSLINRQ